MVQGYDGTEWGWPSRAHGNCSLNHSSDERWRGIDNHSGHWSWSCRRVTFASYGSFGNVWRHFLVPQLERRKCCCCLTWRAQGWCQTSCSVEEYTRNSVNQMAITPRPRNLWLDAYSESNMGWTWKTNFQYNVTFIKIKCNNNKTADSSNYFRTTKFKWPAACKSKQSLNTQESEMVLEGMGAATTSPASQNSTNKSSIVCKTDVRALQSAVSKYSLHS